jgi:hypothetical protein
MRIANMDEAPLPPLAHVFLGGIRGALAGGVLALILG